MTRKSLIVSKAEYLIERRLTEAETSILLKLVKVGNMKEIKDAVQSMNRKRDFTTVAHIIERAGLPDKPSVEELTGIVTDIAVKAASVDSGLKILNTASTKTKDGLLKYIMNLYLRNAARQDRKYKIADGHPNTIGPAQYGNVPADPFVPSFHNPGQDNNSTVQVQDDYREDGYTANDKPSRPFLNQKKKNKKMQEHIKKYIEHQISSPTGGRESIE